MSYSGKSLTIGRIVRTQSRAIVGSWGSSITNLAAVCIAAFLTLTYKKAEHEMTFLPPAQQCICKVLALQCSNKLKMSLLVALACTFT